jgi:hypothetical protein
MGLQVHQVCRLLADGILAERHRQPTNLELKKKGRPDRPSLCNLKNVLRLTFGVLIAGPGAFESILFTFFNPGVPRDKTGLFKHRTQ